MSDTDDVIRRFRQRNAEHLSKVIEAVASNKVVAPIFKTTKHKVTIDGKPRPVLKFGKRLYAGHTLGPLNPSGAGGTVWSGTSLDALKFNINFTEKSHGRRHSAPQDNTEE